MKWYNSSSYNKTHETDSELSKLAQKADQCLKSMAILQETTNLLGKSKLIIYAEVSRPSVNYSCKYYQSYPNDKNTQSIQSHGVTLNQDEHQSIIKDQVELIYNTLKTLIESGFSARQKQ